MSISSLGNLKMGMNYSAKDGGNLVLCQIL